MSEPRLAPKFRNLLSLLKAFRRSAPARENLDALREVTSRWIAQWRLPDPSGGGLAALPGGPGTSWFVFNPSVGRRNGHIFYIHGGGLVFYRVRDYASLLRHWANSAGMPITGFCYSQAPEHSLLEIADDLARSVAQRLASIPAKTTIALAGDSIGAYLALFLALRRHPGRFSRLVLIYPVLALRGRRPSYDLYGSDYPLSSEMMMWFQSLWQRPPTTEFNPFAISPAELATLPQVVVFSAEFDVLRDEAFEWVDYASAKGRPVSHHHFHDLPHDFCLYAGAVPEARAAVETISGQMVGDN
jgi:acetyl esterase